MKRFFILLMASMLLLSACAKAPAEGGLSSFTTQDLNGNPQDEQLFSEYKLTMLNVWGTYCSPCIREMPDLAQLNTEYRDEGFRIVGLIADVASPESASADSAREIIGTTGANYPHLLSDPSMADFLGNIQAIPTTFFLNEKGEQIGEVYVGARSKEEWAAIIEQLLEEVK